MLSTADTGAAVYLACGATDMRKNIDGLAALVTHSFNLDLFSNSLFVFCNKDRDKLKILLWDCNGFWLYYRRLERGRFKWPQTAGGATEAPGVTTVDYRQLQWLLDGLNLQQPQAHKPVTARTVV